MIRDFQIADREMIMNLFYRSVHEVARRDYSPEQLRAWAPDSFDPERWLLIGNRTFICERGSAIAGF